MGRKRKSTGKSSVSSAKVTRSVTRKQSELVNAVMADSLVNSNNGGRGDHRDVPAPAAQSLPSAVNSNNGGRGVHRDKAQSSSQSAQSSAVTEQSTAATETAGPASLPLPGECNNAFSNVMLSNVISEPSGPSEMSSVCSPLGDHIQQSVRDKIGRGEFVELGSLLETWGPRQDQQKGLSLSLNEAGCPVLKPAMNTPRKIFNISTWTSAFLIYASVFISYHPSRAQELLKYMHTIRSASLRFGGQGWWKYDVQFRLRKQRNPQSSWATIDGELWLLFVASPLNQVNNTRTTPTAYTRSSYPGTSGVSTFRRPLNSVGRHPPGYRQGSFCFAFNKAQGCTFQNCKFAHICSVCKKPGHSAAVCRKKS